MDFGRILEAKWEVFGGQNPLKNRCFFGSVFGGLLKHRRGGEEAAGMPQVVYFRQQTSLGSATLSKINYSIITHQKHQNAFEHWK